jgi:uncharacterized RDD family membrane protein YckC
VSAHPAPGPSVASPASNGGAPRAPDSPPTPGSEYSGLATRAIALAADALIIQAVTWIVGGVAAATVALLHPPETMQTALIAIGAVVATMWSAGYFVFFWATTGQTPGNRVMQIRVQDAADGRPLPLGRAVLRLAGALLSALLLFLGYLMILVDARRRALHDRLVGSVVVYAPSTPRASITASSSAPYRTAVPASQIQRSRMTSPAEAP